MFVATEIRVIFYLQNFLIVEEAHVCVHVGVGALELRCHLRRLCCSQLGDADVDHSAVEEELHASRLGMKPRSEMFELVAARWLLVVGCSSCARCILSGCHVGRVGTEELKRC